MTFDYTPFQDPASEIRLLKIHSTPENHDLLVADIATFPVAEAPHYAAISYTWGRPTPVVPIWLNGVEFFVRKNCHYALWQSQLHNTELLIWIDSICINQEDVEEKSIQVRIMGEVFRRANLVFASLGPHGEDSAFLCAAVANFELWSPGAHWDNVAHGKPRKWQTQRLPKRWVSWDSSNAPGVIYFRKHLDTFPHLERVQVSADRFVQRPFFSRLWVLQELSLAQEVFVTCGPELLLWSSLDHFFNTLDHCPDDKYKLQHEFFHTVARFGHGKEKQRLNETSFLNHFSRLRCSDMRDRVFATLTLVNWCDDTDTIFPDYSMSLYDVAVEVLKRSKPMGGTPPSTLKFAGELVEFLRLVDDDIAAYRSISSDRDLIAGYNTIRSQTSTSNAVMRRTNQDTFFRNYLSLPDCCQLARTKDRFCLTMDETNGTLSTEVLDVSRLSPNRWICFIRYARKCRG